MVISFNDLVALISGSTHISGYSYTEIKYIIATMEVKWSFHFVFKCYIQTKNKMRRVSAFSLATMKYGQFSL